MADVDKVKQIESVSTVTMTGAVESAKEHERSVERIRATFALPEDELEALRKIAKRRNISVTDALRQALALDRLILKELDDGKDVILRDAKSELEQKVTFLR
jgi:Ribbon-helix-helix protein, copG family